VHGTVYEREREREREKSNLVSKRQRQKMKDENGKKSNSIYLMHDKNWGAGNLLLEKSSP
jgi:hypothetical protein